MMNKHKKTQEECKFEDSIKAFIEALESSAMFLAIEEIVSNKKYCYGNNESKKILCNTNK